MRRMHIPGVAGFLLMTLCLLIFVGAQVTPVEAQICPDGLSHYWTLDEGTGPMYYDLFGTTDATCTSCPTAVTGIVNGAQRFGLTGDLHVPADLSFDWAKTDSFSIELWMKSDSASTCSDNQVMVGRRDSSTGLYWWVGCWNATGVATFSLFDNNGVGGQIQGSTDLTDGIWHHIVALRDSALNEIALYIDGAKEGWASITYSAGFDSSTAALDIGSLNVAPTYYFQGVIDEVALYDTALPETMIKSHYYLARDYCAICSYPVRIMPLGDSITYGTLGMQETRPENLITGYRQPLYTALSAGGYDIDFVGSLQTGAAVSPPFSAFHEGHSGWHASGTWQGQDIGLDTHIYNWLLANPADVVLLHIGTNDISDGDQNVAEVTTILNEIDRYSKDIPVIVARIINRTDTTQKSAITAQFNRDVEALVTARVANGDKIILVDMENALLYPGDMADALHPNLSGYQKMANVWINALYTFLPSCQADQVIPKTGWSLKYVDSQELVGENGAATNSFDGNTATMWVTKWYGGSTSLPHEIQINLGQVYNINGFRYLPRQDGKVNGRIKQYEFYVSADGTNWGSAVATGTFANDALEKEVQFTSKIGQYIRLRALSEVNGYPWSAVAEINVLGGLPSGNQPPNGVIDSPPADMTINVGDLLTFAGTGSDPDNNLPLSYRWNFGAGSGIPDSTVQNPGSVQFNTAGTFTVTFTVTDALGLSDPTPATRSITVVASGGGVIPRTGWSLKYVDSQELVGENGAATNSFDGNTATMWVTKWYGGSTSLPHEIQINLGQAYNINGFRYLPRQDGKVNGRIKQYEFYVSADGTNWGSAVATGTFANDALEKEVQFTTKIGQYIRLRALSEVNGYPWSAVAEINVLGGLPSGNQPPNGVIDSPPADMTINVGDLLTFAGTGSDPDNNLPLSYRWNFGAGSGIPDSTVQNPGSVQFNTAGTFTVTCTVTDALGLSDPTPATRSITVVASGGGVIPRTGWSLKYVDSQELVGENGAATNSFDGNTATMWVTKWYGGSTALPHEIQINLGQAYNINGFRYLPRQDGKVNGRIKQYEFYVSADGTNWGSAVATGTFANDALEKEVQFTAKIGQYIRLRALSEVNGYPWSAVAEINVLGHL